MSVRVQDVLNLVDDYSATKSGANDTIRAIRQINQAIVYLQRRAGLPSDERIHSFYYNDDQLFYSVPDDFMEEMQLVYHDISKNTMGSEWSYIDYSELLRETGAIPSNNRWGFTTINGKNQIMLLGNNQYSGTLIDSLDNVGDWVAGGDASNLAQNLLNKYVGDGSLSFDIVNATGVATISNPSKSLDIKSLFENHGYFKLWVFMTDVLVDSVSLKLFVDSSNYWVITSSELDDGTVFTANEWKKISWALDDAVKVGTPSITDLITKVEIDFNLNTAFTSAVDFGIDNLFTTIPDYLDLVYRSFYKGKTNNGVPILNLSDATDTINIGDFFPDITDLIARRSALNLYPALRGDKEWYVMYAQEFKEFLRDSSMRFPRKRTNKYLPTRLKR